MINDEELDIVQNLINNHIESISIYTNKDIYHLEKMRNGYTLVFESGEDFRPDDYGYIIQNVQQLKQFFKSYERISIIETDNNIVWEKYRNLERVHRDIRNYNIEGVPNFNETECSICLDSLSSGKINNRLRLGCGHTYHKNCISQIRNHTCPMCRKDIKGVYNLKFGNGKRLRGGGRKKKVIPLLPQPPSIPPPNSSKQEKQTFIKNLKFYIKKYRYMLSAATLIGLLALITKLKNNKSLPEESLPQLQEPLPQGEPLPQQENNNSNIYKKDYREILFEFSRLNERLKKDVNNVILIKLEKEYKLLQFTINQFISKINREVKNKDEREELIELLQKLILNIDNKLLYIAQLLDKKTENKDFSKPFSENRPAMLFGKTSVYKISVHKRNIKFLRTLKF